jgi:hypothetical protein
MGFIRPEAAFFLFIAAALGPLRASFVSVGPAGELDLDNVALAVLPEAATLTPVSMVIALAPVEAIRGHRKNLKVLRIR